MSTRKRMKTEDDIQKVFSLVANGETVIISNRHAVILPEEQYEQYKKFKNSEYLKKIEQAIKRVQPK